MKADSNLNRVRLCGIIVLCVLPAVLIVYIIAGILPPTAVDYSGAEVSFAEEDFCTWDENNIPVSLNQDAIITDTDKFSVSGGNVVISEPGTYRITGNLSDGCIYIAAKSGGTVHLILSDVSISCSEGPPIYASAADKVVITLEDGTENFVTAMVKGGLESAIYAECDLTFNGNGSLTVNSKNGIAVNCTTNVRFVSGDYKITAKENGIRAAYSVSVRDGDFLISSEADGIRTTKAGKSNRKWIGTIFIEGGDITIDSEGDAVNSGSVICVCGGKLSITSGGGSDESTMISEETFSMGDPPQEHVDTENRESAKGLKAGTGIYISDGTLTIDSADDAIHSGGDVTINNGILTLLSNDDGLHGDSSVTVSDGLISIERSREGVEGHYITIDGGEITVTASDDGMNATAGSNPIAALAKLFETEILGTGGKLIINGGNITVLSSGDSLDSNGSIIQTGGNVQVNYAANRDDGALDYDGTYNMTGGGSLRHSDGAEGCLRQLRRRRVQSPVSRLVPIFRKTA